MQPYRKQSDDPRVAQRAIASASAPPGFPQADRLARRGLTVHVSELDITAAALACLGAVGIIDVPQLVQTPADDLLAVPHFGALDLYEIVCQLNEHGLSLAPVPGRHAKGDITPRNREIFRLRLIDGLTLAAIAERVQLGPEQVRKVLRGHYGLTGQPPAVKARQWRADVERTRQALRS